MITMAAADRQEILKNLMKQKEDIEIAIKSFFEVLDSVSMRNLVAYVAQWVVY